MAPSPSDLVEVLKEAVHSTLVVSLLLFVFVIVAQTCDHVAGSVVNQVIPVGT